jgi:hypothetical protein
MQAEIKMLCDVGVPQGGGCCRNAEIVGKEIIDRNGGSEIGAASAARDRGSR